MATPKTEAPPRQIVTITYTSGTVEQYEMGKPRQLYDVNRLGVARDEIEAGFFVVWAAAGKPGLNGHELTIDNARPALEAWLDTVSAVVTEEMPMTGPPTKPPKPSRGRAG